MSVTIEAKTRNTYNVELNFYNEIYNNLEVISNVEIEHPRETALNYINDVKNTLHQYGYAYTSKKVDKLYLDIVKDTFESSVIQSLRATIVQKEVKFDTKEFYLEWYFDGNELVGSNTLPPSIDKRVKAFYNGVQKLTSNVYCKILNNADISFLNLMGTDVSDYQEGDKYIVFMWDIGLYEGREVPILVNLSLEKRDKGAVNWLQEVPMNTFSVLLT